MGRSRGGLTTKIHALTDARGLPLELVLTPGQAGDRPVAARLLGHLHENTIVLADKAYDADWRRRQIEAAGAAPNIPPMVHRRRKPCFSPALYSARNRIERFFNKIKHFRRLATRYEKHAANFLAMLKLAAVHLWLKTSKNLAVLAGS
jgi:transposase